MQRARARGCFGGSEGVRSDAPCTLFTLCKSNICTNPYVCCSACTIQQPLANDVRTERQLLKTTRTELNVVGLKVQPHYSRPCLPLLWPRLYAEPFGLGEKREYIHNIFTIFLLLYQIYYHLYYPRASELPGY